MKKNSKVLEILPIRSRSSSEGNGKNLTLSLVLLILLNIAVGLLLYKIKLLATVHALILPAIAILSLFLKKPFVSLMFLSYIANSHVLWRMTKAKVFWEYSKYVSIILILLIMSRYVKRLKNFILPGLFLFFLSISIPLTINYYGSVSSIRRAISFNLAGPVLLTLSIILFYNITKIPKSRMKWIFLSLAMPSISIASISLYSMLTRRVIFTETSNFIASGGFGPNQVSATLGLGALLMLILGINYYQNTTHRIIIFIVALWLFVQSILTFSRGGPFNFTVATVFFLWYSIKDRNTRFKVIGSILFLSVLMFILLPKIQRVTQGQLRERFTNLNPTGRDKIALAEIELFEKHPLFGIGPGVGISERTGILGYYIASHTEYTRLLAEHGIFGMGALLILLYLLYAPIKKAPKVDIKAENAALIVWIIVEMAHSATRIAITGFLPGIAYLNIHREDDKEE